LVRKEKDEQESPNFIDLEIPAYKSKSQPQYKKTEEIVYPTSQINSFFEK
jgi:hypothetical protein